MHAQTDHDLEATYKLIAGVFRQAVRDARRGCPEAQEWLQIVAPDVFDKLVEVERVKPVDTLRRGNTMQPREEMAENGRQWQRIRQN